MGATPDRRRQPATFVNRMLVIHLIGNKTTIPVGPMKSYHGVWRSATTAFLGALRFRLKVAAVDGENNATLAARLTAPRALSHARSRRRADPPAKEPTIREGKS